MMRSVLVILRPLRGHHGQYFEYCKQPEANIRYLLQWAKPSHWFQALMVPTLQAALVHARPIREAGLDKNCSVGFPLFGPPEEANDIQTLLYHHFKLLLNVLKQLALFVVMPQSPPWVFVSLLDPELDTDAFMKKMRRLWHIVVTLQQSTVKEEVEIKERLPFICWQTFLEPFQLMVHADWKVSEALLKYVNALFPKWVLYNSMQCENGFNLLRHAEQTAAKHMKKSNTGIFSGRVCALHEQYPNLQQVDPSDADMQAVANHHVSIL